MTTFLQNIASELIKAGDYHQKIVVMPNKRSGVFLRKALVEAEQKVILSPQIFSIQSFINHLAPYRMLDSLELLFDFFQVYREKHADNSQSFEEFMRWASPILTDFDEIDAYHVDAKEVFTYINEVKKLEDWQLQPDSPKLVSEYLQFYASLYDLYRGLHKKLEEKNSAYQGMNSRWVANHIDDLMKDFADEQIIFAGFNALTHTEKIIIDKLIENNKAKIFWDADKYYMNPGFEAGKFMLQNQKNFPDFKWIFDEFDKPKEIEIIGVPGKSTQAQVVTENLLKMVENEEDLLETAVVLNETDLLLPFVNSLPAGIDTVNITLGLPLTHLPVTSLFSQFVKLFYEYEQYGRFNVDTLVGLIHQTYLEQILSPEEQKSNRVLLQQLFQFKTKLISGKFWMEILEHSGSYLNKFFAGGYEFQNLLRIFFDLIDFLSGKNLSGLDRLALVKMEKLLQYLQDFNTKTGEIKSIRTFQFLFNQILQQERLAFEGEPLEGLQVMGLLETRLLDFKHVILTSVNEGVLPKSNNERSIIPFELKKHFGLPMPNDKTAVTAYHFYRLLQRAEKITLLYNTDTGGLGGAEQSRFITQLENELDATKHKITRKQLVLPAEITPGEKQEIKKNDFVQKQLERKAESGYFSVSALSTYIRNPLIFYKRYILKLEEADDISEAIPSHTMGSIIHDVMEELYKHQTGKLLSLNDFLPMLKSYENLCLKYFIKHSFGEDVPVNKNLIEGKNLIAFEIIKKNVKDILLSDKKLVEKSNDLEIVSVEEEIIVPLELNGKKIRLIAYIDRVDRLNGKLRIIDYKTGSVKSLLLKEDMEEVIRRPDRAKVFQLLTYAWIYRQAGKLKPEDFPFQTGILSTLHIKNEVMTPIIFGNDEIDEKILDEFEKYLKILLEEIYDKDIPFVETDSPY